MKIQVVLWLALALGLPAAMASPIMFTVSAFGSGTLNGVSFPDGLITFTQVTDTSLISLCPGPVGPVCAPASTSNTVTIGASIYTLTDSTQFYADPGPMVGDVGIADVTADDDMLGERSSGVKTVNLMMAVGPVAGPFIPSPEVTSPTTGGPLDILYDSGNVTFTATAGSSAPEPGSLGLMLLGAIGLHALRSRVVRRGYDLHKGSSDRDSAVAGSARDASGAGSR